MRGCIISFFKKAQNCISFFFSRKHFKLHEKYFQNFLKKLHKLIEESFPSITKETFLPDEPLEGIYQSFSRNAFYASRKKFHKDAFQAF